MPHLTALGNLLYAGIEPADAKKFLALCGVEEGVYPFRMSGGMAQRTGLARAFAAGADTVLLDEPFKSLDPGLKKRLLDLTASLYRTGAAVLVTHDADEAEYLAAARSCWTAAKSCTMRVKPTAAFRVSKNFCIRYRSISKFARIGAESVPTENAYTVPRARTARLTALQRRIFLSSDLCVYS